MVFGQTCEPDSVVLTCHSHMGCHCQVVMTFVFTKCGGGDIYSKIHCNGDIYVQCSILVFLVFDCWMLPCTKSPMHRNKVCGVGPRASIHHSVHGYLHSVCT